MTRGSLVLLSTFSVLGAIHAAESDVQRSLLTPRGSGSDKLKPIYHPWSMDAQDNGGQENKGYQLRQFLRDLKQRPEDVEAVRVEEMVMSLRKCAIDPTAPPDVKYSPGVKLVIEQAAGLRMGPGGAIDSICNGGNLQGEAGWSVPEMSAKKCATCLLSWYHYRQMKWDEDRVHKFGMCEEKRDKKKAQVIKQEKLWNKLRNEHGEIVKNPGKYSRTYSSVLDLDVEPSVAYTGERENQEHGEGHAISMLGANGGWVPQSYQGQGEWLQMDLGDTGMGPYLIRGIITQGHARQAWWVTKFKVRYHQDDPAKTGHLTEFDKIFDGNLDKNTKKENIFNQDVRARYVRIVPVEYHNRIALRVAVIVSFKPDYKTGGWRSWHLKPLVIDEKPKPEATTGAQLLRSSFR